MQKSNFINALQLSAGFLWGAVALLSPPLARGAVLDREFTFEAEEVWVGNLIGQVRIGSHGGKDIVVRVHVDGRDATPELLKLEEHHGHRAELAIIFPVEEHRRYVYPALGSGSRTQFRAREHDGDWLSELLHGREIEVRGESFRDAIEVWADVEVLLPGGKDVTIFLGVGAMEARDVRGDLDLDTQSGRITVDALEGRLRADTGSGAVHVGSVRGDVDVDTGSGSVDLADISKAQRVLVDTGSGGVDVRNVEARELVLDTGSGSVDVADARVEEMNVDTGSGGVEAVDIEADGVLIDTGSGSVELELLRLGGGRYEVDTGSGGIRLRLPREVSAVFEVDTGSGGIEVDLEGVDLGRKPRHEARFTVGSGTSRVRLSTGSGGVRIGHGQEG
ncbi:MAG TPA: DUF4097 family beta strand repeat-containing protein [Candidatus Krumholzibacteria bacterium]|nr:DUF4097 family beta strand repeat-containing protein [Candidatus Krumholzibacteria bacterium]